MVRWKLGIIAVVSGLITLKRAAELHFAETEAVAELVRGVGKLFHFRAAFGIE